jgi:hypothetical protein
MERLEPVILFRPEFNGEVQSEIEVARRHMPVVESRVGLSKKLVIGRYSVLPYYMELEHDLAVQGSRLANTLRQHQWIAGFHWYETLVDMTPRSWRTLASVKRGVPLVVKGATNSRKFEWKQKMFAPTWDDALRITSELGQDGLIGPQGLIYREHVPLRVLEVGLNGLPFANEWRFFFWGRTNLAYGFYWTATEERAPITEDGIRLALQAADRIADHAQFFVVDVAETADGRWIVIEVNDGQMSGLSDVNPLDLYMNLATVASVQPLGAEAKQARAKEYTSRRVVPEFPAVIGGLRVMRARKVLRAARRYDFRIKMVTDALDCDADAATRLLVAMESHGLVERVLGGQDPVWRSTKLGRRLAGNRAPKVRKR